MNVDVLTSSRLIFILGKECVNKEKIRILNINIMSEKKEIKMEVTPKEKEKLSYEQLENVCHQLSEQSRSLYQRLQEANMTNMFKRLDYLFAVVENREGFPKDFVDKCVKEIVDTMTVPEEPEKKEEE